MAINLFNGDKCINICLKNTNKYVFFAVEALRKDFSKISEYRVCPKYTTDDDYAIIIEENLDTTIDAIDDESFIIKTENGVIKIIANTYLCTMWGYIHFL